MSLQKQGIEHSSGCVFHNIGIEPPWTDPSKMTAQIALLTSDLQAATEQIKGIQQSTDILALAIFLIAFAVCLGTFNSLFFK